jgi:AraC-like DNA-binding protein
MSDMARIDPSRKNFQGHASMGAKPEYVIGGNGKGWVNARHGAIDLLYLAWGERRYGKNPHGLERHPDWIFIAPQSGAPVAILNGHPLPLRAGMLLIVPPGTSLDMKDVGVNSCRIRTWAWRTPPEFEELRPKSGSHLLLELTTTEQDEIRELHRLFRYEVRNMDAFSGRALEILRARLDLCLARRLGESSAPRSPDQLFRLAMRWLENHPKADAYIGDLCDSLRISEGVLNRLFTERVGCSPQKIALQIRLAEARRLVSEGWSVKATAYHLGYKHPNDLSRALSRSPAAAARPRR